MKRGKLAAFLGDLAPNLKAEKRMLGLLSQLGILEALLMCRNKEEAAQCHVVKMALTRLVDNEYIQPEIATKYLNILAEVIEIKVSSDVLFQATINVKENNTNYRDTAIEILHQLKWKVILLILKQ